MLRFYLLDKYRKDSRFCVKIEIKEEKDSQKDFRYHAFFEVCTMWCHREEFENEVFDMCFYVCKFVYPCCRLFL